MNEVHWIFKAHNLVVKTTIRISVVIMGRGQIVNNVEKYNIYCVCVCACVLLSLTVDAW